LPAGETSVTMHRNKFARAQDRAKTKSKYAVGETIISTDDQLTRLEDDIRRLKVEFDTFFNGGSKRAPYDTKGRVETILKRIGDDRTLTYAQRFRYNSLNARYNAFRDLWRRIMQGREEGRDQQSAGKASRKSAPPPHSVSFVCVDAHKEIQIIKNLYDSLIQAKRQCGEPTSELSFPRFHSVIASKADGLKEKSGCDRVKFSVSVDHGHVSLKAKAFKTSDNKKRRP